MFGLTTCLHIPAVLTMMILLGERFAEPWDGFWGCVLNYLQTLLVFLAILAHSVAGILADRSGSDGFVTNMVFYLSVLLVRFSQGIFRE